MKNFLKHLLLITLSLSFIIFSGVACTKPQEENNITAKQVIDDSVAQMENMFATEENSASINQTFALVLPNQDVDYENERISIIKGSCFSMYIAKYVSNLTDFEIGTTYKDLVEESGVSLEFLFRAEKVDDGITANMEMHQSAGQQTRISKIQLYFRYDYNNETALDTTIVTFDTASIALAKLNYQTNEALSYEFDMDQNNHEQIKDALKQKTFDFDKFMTNDIIRYKFAKIQVEVEQMQAYSYLAGQENQDLSVTQEQLKDFYNDLYSKVKNECIERDFLDKTSAVNKTYYVDMYTYASQKVMQLA